jgi:hypothetical protein
VLFAAPEQVLYPGYAPTGETLVAVVVQAGAVVPFGGVDESTTLFAPS